MDPDEEHSGPGLAPTIGTCESFITRNGVQEEVDIAIVPLEIRKRDDGFHISWSCNFGSNCHNSMCVRQGREYSSH